LDTTTRGQIEDMIEKELEEGILSKIKWLSEVMPVSEDLALGYMLGRLEQKALRIGLHSAYRFTDEQKEEYDGKTREIISRRISEVRRRIGIEQHK
jgi:hypothetical protein